MITVFPPARPLTYFRRAAWLDSVALEMAWEAARLAQSPAFLHESGLPQWAVAEAAKTDWRDIARYGWDDAAGESVGACVRRYLVKGAERIAAREKANAEAAACRP